MYKTKTQYGIVLVSGETAACYHVIKQGTHIDIKKLIDYDVELQKKQKKGGQSAQRIGRLREERQNIQINAVVDMMIHCYMIKNKTAANIEGLLVAGPSLLKKRVTETSEFKQYFDNLLLRVVTCGEIRDNTVWDTYADNCDVFATVEEQESIELTNDIVDMMAQANEQLVFGIDEVLIDIQACMLRQVLVSSTHPNLDELHAAIEYDCQVHEVPEVNMRKIGIDMVGIRWY